MPTACAPCPGKINAIFIANLHYTNVRNIFWLLQRTYRLQVPVFYLQGGFDMDKLTGMNRFMMRCMVKLQLPRLEKKKDRTAEEEEMLTLLKKGGDKVNEKNLGSILKWYGQEKQQTK